MTTSEPATRTFPGGTLSGICGLVLLLAAGCAPHDSGVAAAMGAGEGSIESWAIESAEFVFLTNRDGNGEVYLAAGPGRGPDNLTHSPSFDGFASWSPDGGSLVFDSDRAGDGNRDVYVRSLTGTDAIRLTTDPGFDFVPKWSPDGDWIVFVSTRDSDFDPRVGNVDAFRGEIYRIRPDRTGLQRLTDDPAHDQAPAWSADGAQIAWCRVVDGAGDLWVMSADGSAPRPLVTTPDFECSPAYSPDGARLAWRTTRGDSSWIVVADIDGSGATRVPSRFPNHGEPGWSPDSRWLCFTAIDDEGGLDIYATEVDASGDPPILLVGGPDREQACAWRPGRPSPSTTGIH